jgi:ABC-type glycerol-3-phosphate transport system permease component
VSPAILCLGYTSLPAIQEMSGSFTLQSLFLLSFVHSLLLLPSAALWLEPCLSRLSLSQTEVAYTLGLTRSGYFRWIVWPQSKELWVRIGIFAFAGSLGELLLTSLFIPQMDFLATAARKLSFRYAFDEAEWSVVIYVVTLFVLMTLATLLISRRRKDTHERA